MTRLKREETVRKFMTQEKVRRLSSLASGPPSAFPDSLLLLVVAVPNPCDLAQVRRSWTQPDSSEP